MSWTYAEYDELEANAAEEGRNDFSRKRQLTTAERKAV